MPLFFFLAGLFVAQSARRTFYDYLMSKASVIIYPYFVWSILEGTLQYFASRFTNNHLSPRSLFTILYEPIDQYWFLYAIFLMYMVFWWIHKRTISNTNLVLCAIVLYAMEVSGVNNFGWSVLHAFCAFLIYFALGARVAETSFFTNLKLFNGALLLSIAFSVYVLVAVAVAMNVSGLPFLHAVLAVMGNIATIALAMSLSGSPAWSFVRTMGVYSLEIYVGHTIFSAAARIAMLKGFGYSEPILQTVVGTAVGIGLPMVLAIWGPKVGLPYLFTWSRSRQNGEISAIKTLRA